MSSLGLAITGGAAAITLIILPTRILDVAPESIKNTALGLLSFIGLMLAVFVQPMAGGLSDRSRSRWGRRRPYILVGVAFSVLFLLGMGLASSYIALLIVVSFLQFTTNIALGPYQALVRDLVPYENRGTASAIKMVVEVAGGMALAATIGALMGLYSAGQNFFWVWLTLGLLALTLLLGGVATVLSIPAGADRAPAPLSVEGKVATSGSTKTHPDFPWFLLSRFIIVFAIASIQTYSFFFLRDVVKLENPARVSGWLILVVGIAVVVSTYPAGVLADRFGRRRMIVASGVLGSMATFLLLSSRTVGGVMTVAALTGLAIGMFLSANWAMATDLVSAKRAAQQLGYLNVATAGGAALARLNGPWVDLLNTGGSTLGYSILLAVCGILFLVGTALIVKVRPGEQGMAGPALVSHQRGPLAP